MYQPEDIARIATLWWEWEESFVSFENLSKEWSKQEECWININLTQQGRNRLGKELHIVKIGLYRHHTNATLWIY